MKIFVYADVQMGPRSLFNEPTASGFGLRLDDGVEACQWIADRILEEKPDVVVNLGDTVDPIGGLGTETIGAVTIGMGYISTACETVNADHYVMIGNHDLAYTNMRTSSVEFLDKFPNTKIVRHPLYLEHTVMVPFTEDYNYAREILKKAEEEGKTIGFTHLDFKELNYNSSYKSTDGLDATDFKLKIFNGHVHIPQKHGAVECIGSVIQHRTTEWAKERYVIVIEGDDVRRINNDFSPHLFKTDKAELLNDLPDNTYLWFEYDPEKIHEEEVAESLARFTRTIVTKKVSIIDLKEDIVILEGESSTEIFNNYLDNVYTRDNSLDLDKLREKGNKIIAESEV
ncbi:recombination endonuclease subunit [Maribacter phage Molly_5]|uniref:Recombination endonuclease subunit n=1 Tax=Maribacter phage Molly_1 TaxID=2745685 RepID=A0A8E4XVD0_9CAUD|nr:recombination endonuclease subunit [Maribacter phage Molly_1]QQO97597.1 recombination endonuclease subunit [Maribacter phage Molly_2]QQO97797.1 recombination endonuclease subunit [Maribacter phage Molly_3]QQO97998.1 recombination endonuclease subunit [Maribacter phage Molly_4]QQO98198.1 recombination endonuclease subunit [Maribacter phage Molly_5]QQO97397.1 recombination endonuclease subunit [Maribacter phage Molly_1]